MPPAERPPVPGPRRLIDGRDAVAVALREIAHEAPPSAAQESAAWRRLAPPRAPRLWWWFGASALVAGLVLIFALRMGHDHQPAVAVSPLPAETAPAPAIVAAPAAPAPGAFVTPPGPAHAVEPAAPARQEAQARVEMPETPGTPSSPATDDGAPAPEPPRLALAPRPRPLPAGSAALADEATVEVSAGAVARASADAAWVRVLLDRGEVSLHVEKRVPDGPGFEVAAGPYRFRVLGTRFRVARAEGVELWVQEGRVAVTRGGRSLGVVGAGGHWAGRVALRPVAGAAAAPGESPPTTAPAVPAARARCAELAAGPATAREAVSCYLALSEGDPSGAENWLYEVGRIRRDMLDDAAGAIGAFKLYRTRFPDGGLRVEADLSIVELLPKVGRHREAIDEIGRLLAGGRVPERRVELLLVRANIYREVLEDYARAERDYAAVEAVRGGASGDATFLRGVCLQSLGRADEARAAFERYLATGASRYADEAQRRLQRLAR